ncbi:MAG: S8 family peptidase [Chloroflexi bacterium]|nr:S8 family peptidase [Chloroflexota bacterium]
MSILPIEQVPWGVARWPTSSWGQKLAHLALVVLTVFALLVPMPGVAQAGDEEKPRVLPQLLREASERPDHSFRVIVTRRGHDTSADDHISSKGYKKIKEVAGQAFVAEVKGKDISDLGKHKAVTWITIDAPMVNTGAIDTTRLATLYGQTINATQLWSTSSSLNVTGEGIGIAILDTGVNETLSDFKGTGGIKRVVKQVLFNSNTTNVNDGHGHGTHIAGIIAGNSWLSTSSTVHGKYIGVAPNANLISVKVSDDQGMSYISDVINAIGWVVNNRQTYNIRVMNLSLISSVAESYLTSMLDAAVERAWFNGILVVVSAGNMGFDSMKYPPANDPFVITVGAADPMGTTVASDDTVAPWSSYGTSQDGVAKPDIVAPGRYIVSTLASGGSTLAKTYPDRIVDGSYIRMSGTSMAAPVVAGLAALAFQAHPEWTNDQVKWLLSQAATHLGSADPATGTFTLLPGQGAGETNAAAVVTFAGTPEFANQGLTISSQLVGPGGATTYDGSTVNSSTSSWSTSSWSTSSWSTSSWSTSSWSTSSWSTSSWSTANYSTSSWTSVFDED